MLQKVLYFTPGIYIARYTGHRILHWPCKLCITQAPYFALAMQIMRYTGHRTLHRAWTVCVTKSTVLYTGHVNYALHRAPLVLPWGIELIRYSRYFTSLMMMMMTMMTSTDIARDYINLNTQCVKRRGVCGGAGGQKVMKL